LEGIMSFLDSLFGGGDETHVGTSVSRVISDDMLPTSVKSGVIKAFFNEGNIPDYLMEELTGSIGVRAERMYAYAKKNYTNGLPSGQVYSSTQGRNQVEAVIEQIEGQQVIIDYSHFGPANALHVSWLKLQTQYGYNSATNELATLSASKNTPVYLVDMVVQVPSGSTVGSKVLEQWGGAPNLGYCYSRPAGSADFMDSVFSPAPNTVQYTSVIEVQALVTYEWMSGGSIQTNTVAIPLGDYLGTGDYFMASYELSGRTKYWIYKNKSGTYPTLDNVYVDAPFESGTYFPFTHFRYNKTAITSDKNSSEYKTMKKMVNHLGMDLDTVSDAIASNPNIGDVEQAVMQFSVPSVSADHIECRYLFDYFDNLNYQQGGQHINMAQLLMARFFGRGGMDIGVNTIVIKDNKFRMSLQNSGITKTLVAGSIGDVGSYSATLEGTTHQYRHQVAVGLYEQVSVEGLRMTYYVWGNYTTTGDGTSEILLIPLDRSITENYSIPDREVLYTRSLHIVFNSRVVTHVSWYQTSLFQAVMIVVAVVMTVIDFGTDGGSWIATALELTGTAAVVATVVFNLVVGQLIGVVAKQFVKAVGVDVAFLVVIAAIAAGAYRVAAEGMKAGKTFAEVMLMVSNGLERAIVQAKFSDLLDEKSQLSVWMDEQTKLLDKANELLENSHLLQPMTIFGEKPEDFYNRTVHFGNIGTLGITAISSYVDLALTLPKINDTLGENDYGLSS
jgi:hypothetical protein